MKKLLKQLIKMYREKEQEASRIADICSELDNQLESLSGLACLNYPNATSPILEKLHLSLRALKVGKRSGQACRGKL